MELRHYQKEALESIKNSLITNNSTLVQLPTGTGKTVVLSYFIKSVMAHSAILIIVHREEIVLQIASTIKQICNIDPNILTGMTKIKNQNQIFVCSVQFLNGKNGKVLLDKLNANYIIIDECHHSICDSYKSIIETCKTNQPNVKLLGFTATVQRSDGVGLNKVFDTLCFNKPIKYFVKNNFLVKPTAYKVFCDIELNKLQLSKINQDFVINSNFLSVLQSSNWKKALCEKWWDKASTKKTIAFCASISQSLELVDHLKTAGIKAEHLDGETNSLKRKAMLLRYKSGETQFISNVGVLTEGYDEPSTECIMMCRPTKSQLFYIQCIGRALRICKNKNEAIIIDFASTTHSLIQLADITDQNNKIENAKNKKFFGGSAYFFNQYLLSLNARRSILEFESGNLYDKILDLLNHQNLNWACFGTIVQLLVNREKTLIITPKNNVNYDVYINTEVVFNGNQDQCIEFCGDYALEFGDLMTDKNKRFQNSIMSQPQIKYLFLQCKLLPKNTQSFSYSEAQHLINFHKFTQLTNKNNLWLQTLSLYQI